MCGGSFVPVSRGSGPDRHVGRARLGSRRVPRAVPPLSPRDVRRGHRAGARHRAAAAGAAQRPGQPRLPVQRPARLRQDDQRPHPGPLPQLRAGPDRRRRAGCASPARTWHRRAAAASTSSRSTRPPTAASTTPVTCARRRSSRRRRRATRSTSSTRPTWSRGAGFNALLKLVEEPPEHVKFIFATTEPEKVIGTIRSRTHHYPFRLVPPGELQDYLAHDLRAREGRHRRPRRAPARRPRGAGSVRDSLSVLDQLLAGARRRGRDLPAARSRCSATPTRACSTTSSRPSPPATGRRCSGSSTGSSRPATTRAASPRTCSSGCAT